jgi:D-alanine-D-alanine ligase
MRVVPRKQDPNFVYSLEIKRDWEKLVDYECPAKLDPGILGYLEEFSIKAFKLLECRDFARVDFRVSPDGLPYFLEINPLAGLNPHSSDLCIMSRLAGVSYNDLITAILNSALKRYPQCGQ